MKTKEEIEKITAYGFRVISSDGSGGMGIMRVAPFDKTTVVWTFVDKHVSVAPHSHIPNWDDMCKIKDLFYNDEDEVWQCHPKKSEYVNIVKNCLHLWEGRLMRT